MEIILAILTAIAAVPKIFDQVEKLVIIIATGIRQIRRKQRHGKLDKATEKLVRTKDQRDLEELLRNP